MVGESLVSLGLTGTSTRMSMALRSPSIMSVKYCCGSKTSSDSYVLTHRLEPTRYVVRSGAKSSMKSMKKVSRRFLKS
jgi:hypothetical protein